MMLLQLAKINWNLCSLPLIIIINLIFTRKQRLELCKLKCNLMTIFIRFMDIFSSWNNVLNILKKNSQWEKEKEEKGEGLSLCFIIFSSNINV